MRQFSSADKFLQQDFLEESSKLIYILVQVPYLPVDLWQSTDYLRQCETTPSAILMSGLDIWWEVCPGAPDVRMEV